MVSMDRPPLVVREGSRYQIGWFFGKIPNGPWHPPSFLENYVANLSHCLMGVSTRPAWHSEFYAWLFLLWPRLIQNSCWINLKGGAFWENLSSVVTSLDSRKTNWEIIKRTFLLAIRGITVNIVTTTEILIPVQAFLKAFIASYSLFLGDIIPFL